MFVITKQIERRLFSNFTSTAYTKSNVSASSASGMSYTKRRKMEWVYHGALRNTTAHWNDSRQFPSSPRVLLRPVQKCLLQSNARRHHQDPRTSFSTKEICGWRSQWPLQNQGRWHQPRGLRSLCASPLPRILADWRGMTDGVESHSDEVKLSVHH